MMATGVRSEVPQLSIKNRLQFCRTLALSRGAHVCALRRRLQRVLGRLLYSTQFEDCRFILLVELDDVAMTAPQEPCDIVGSAIAESNPNELRRSTSQESKSVKILVLADHHAAVLTREIPDDRIRRPAVPKQANV